MQAVQTYIEVCGFDQNTHLRRKLSAGEHVVNNRTIFICGKDLIRGLKGLLELRITFCVKCHKE